MICSHSFLNRFLSKVSASDLCLLVPVSGSSPGNPCMTPESAAIKPWALLLLEAKEKSNKSWNWSAEQRLLFFFLKQEARSWARRNLIKRKPSVTKATRRPPKAWGRLGEKDEEVL